MSCCRPFKIKNPNYKPNGTLFERTTREYFEVPCGWCLNCRIDKRNLIEDSAHYLLKKFNNTGAFVTFTYDDLNIQNLKVGTDSFGQDRYTLRYKDLQDFLKRLRQNLQRKNMYDNCNAYSDFKFICASEYGGMFDRPHYHCLFFGLDYKYCEQLFFDTWHKGICDSLPIKNGVVRYILKYLDKAPSGKDAILMYDNKGLERPRHRISINFYQDLVFENWNKLVSNNGYYPIYDGKGTERSLNSYLKNKFHIQSNNLKAYQLVDNSMRQAGIPKVQFNGYYNSWVLPGCKYSIGQINQFKKDSAIAREKELVRQSLERNGEQILHSSVPLENIIKSDVSLLTQQALGDITIIDGELIPF